MSQCFVVSLVIVVMAVFVLMFAAAALAYRPIGQFIRRQEYIFATVLQRRLLLRLSDSLCHGLSRRIRNHPNCFP